MVIDLSVYSKEVIISVLHRLSYIFTGKLVCKDKVTAVIEFIKFEDGYDKENVRELIVKELNDQIKGKNKSRNRGVRNLLLAHAFSKTNFIKDNG